MRKVFSMLLAILMMGSLVISAYAGWQDELGTPEKTEEVDRSKPSSLDLDDIGADIDYPKDRHYLKKYETMYVKVETANALHGLRDGADWKSMAIEVEKGTKVLVIAKDGFSQDGTNYTYCCSIFEIDGEYYAGWINLASLSNKK